MEKKLAFQILGIPETKEENIIRERYLDLLRIPIRRMIRKVLNGSGKLTRRHSDCLRCRRRA